MANSRGSFYCCVDGLGDTAPALLASPPDQRARAQGAAGRDAGERRSEGRGVWYDAAHGPAGKGRGRAAVRNEKQSRVAGRAICEVKRL
jgi:hypothetical protein